MLPVFGIDVFATPFPKEHGCAIYEHGRTRLLVIRLEDLSARGPTALMDLLDLDTPVDLPFDTRRSRSQTGESYRRVVETFAVDRETCDRIYSSPFIRHFYPDDLISRFVDRWTDGAEGR